ncbi:sensor histidine kinase [Actinoplanes sp. N902-109]|uniref:sensor histidine kinase n=1 Tax=Actinoplanes sp. (strain N902-109) TaxID=649831 RepID=UPI0003293DF9|nr:sensor histidine kinase [Actinoplanes sp. N902-109]AGL15817.1 signal transduction histidine kinase-like protein [Actinoplanes sp. N902-109]
MPPYPSGPFPAGPFPPGRHPSGPFPPRRRRPHDRAAAPAFIALGFHLFGNAKEAAALAHPADVIAVVLLFIGPLALMWRRRAHLLVLILAAAASIGYATMLPPSWTFAVAPVIALHAAVKAGRGRAAAPIAAAGYLGYLTVTWFLAEPLGVGEASRASLRIAILTALGLLLTMFIGEASRSRAAYLRELSRTATERARAHEEQEKRQASDERLRIARELHDVLGHHLSLINVQAGVGLHLMESRPEQAREALTTIKTASAEALREVRAVLDALRPDQEAAPRQPALGLDRLSDLTSDAGFPVTVDITGERRPLPSEVDRAAYRIVQEALTNVRRHALASSVRVAIAFTPAELCLSVCNDGTARPAATDDGSSAGTGIAGMRARAETLGGTLRAGPRPEGGYLVEALLPIDPTGRHPAGASRDGEEVA